LFRELDSAGFRGIAGGRIVIGWLKASRSPLGDCAKFREGGEDRVLTNLSESFGIYVKPAFRWPEERASRSGNLREFLSGIFELQLSRIFSNVAAAVAVVASLCSEFDARCSDRYAPRANATSRPLRGIDRSEIGKHSKELWFSARRIQFKLLTGIGSRINFHSRLSDDSASSRSLRLR